MMQSFKHLNNAWALLSILLGIVGIIILCVIVPPLQTIIGIGSGIGALALLIITLKKIHRSMQLKEYFWQIFFRGLVDANPLTIKIRDVSDLNGREKITYRSTQHDR